MAQNNLGWCYLNGKGVKQDKEKAVELFRKAADQGDAMAQFNLGLSYRDPSVVLWQLWQQRQRQPVAPPPAADVISPAASAYSFPAAGARFFPVFAGTAQQSAFAAPAVFLGNGSSYAYSMAKGGVASSPPTMVCKISNCASVPVAAK